MEEIPGAAKQNVLIVDDTQTVRSVVKSCLTTIGFRRIGEAVNGRDALKLLQNHRVDLVICDWEMPAMDGLELLEQVRKLERNGNVPFIMLTGSSDAELVKKCIELGVDGYVVKPFQPQVLCDKVIAVCRPAASNEYSLD